MTKPFVPPAYAVAEEEEPQPQPFVPPEYAAPEVPAAEAPGYTESALRGAAQGASFGLSDEFAGGHGLWAQLAREAVNPELYSPAGGLDGMMTRGKDRLARLLEAYRSNRDESRAANQAAREANPKTYFGGALAGGLATAPLTGGGGVARTGLSLSARALAGARAGLLPGAVGGFGGSDADLTQGDFGRVAGDSATGLAFGAAAGAALPVIGEGASRLYNGFVRPTAEAIFLRSRGVPLTTGQMNPAGLVNQIEESATSIGGIGPAIAGQREAARQGWQSAVLDEARAPGAVALDRSRSLQERLADAYEGFGENYDAIRGATVRPETASGRPLTEAFTDAVNSSALATDSTRRTATRFLEDQASTLARARLPGGHGEVPEVPAEALMSLRSAVREAASDANRAGEIHQLRILQEAERATTEALESGLPQEFADMLRATDARYATYKTVEDAVARAGDAPAGFSPFNLQQAVRAANEKGAFARGAGGELREMASAGRNVLDQRAPQTGARALMAPPILREALAGASYVANLPGPQRFLLGETGLQQGVQRMVRAVQQSESPAARLLRQYRNPTGAEAGLLAGGDSRPTTQKPEPQPGAPHRLRQVLESNPQAFGSYASGLQQAAARGNDAFAAHLYILQSRDAGFQALLRRMEEGR